jgi:hypothetical protein
LSAISTPSENSMTPDEHLAARIADALQAAGLIPAAKLPELREKVAAGTAREADWRAWLAPARAEEPPRSRDE